MRIYIAGPMSGHEDLNEPAFRAAADMLRREGHDPTIPHDITPREHDGPCLTTYAAAQSGHDSACYLRADLIAMLQRAAAEYGEQQGQPHATTHQEGHAMHTEDRVCDCAGCWACAGEAQHEAKQ